MGINRGSITTMTIRIQTDDSGVDWTEVANLFTAIGWGRREPDQLKAAFGKSTFKRFAFDGAKLVGFGRTIDDGVYYVTVVDMVIDPDYQRQGVGTQIMQSLQAALKGFLIPTLTAVPQVQPFYARLGWRTLKTGMMLPRSEEQAKLNCE